MDTFSPEFSEYWLPPPAESRDIHEPPVKERQSASQDQALEELNERINAARSVV